jgi:hypothetical protein
VRGEGPWLWSWLRLCMLAAAHPIHERPFATQAEWVAFVGDNMEQRQRRADGDSLSAYFLGFLYQGWL